VKNQVEKSLEHQQQNQQPEAEVVETFQVEKPEAVKNQHLKVEKKAEKQQQQNLKKKHQKHFNKNKL
jgi:hypothetical protein